MSGLKQGWAQCKRWTLSEKGFAVALAALGTLFVAIGAHRFWVRPEHFGVTSALACGVGAVGAFFLLLITDYVFHHAPLVFIPWFVCLIYFALIEPHFAVGLGFALWYMLAAQLRG